MTRARGDHHSEGDDDSEGGHHSEGDDDGKGDHHRHRYQAQETPVSWVLFFL